MNTEPARGLPDDLDIWVIARGLWQRRIIILYGLFIGFVLGVVHLHMATYFYTATMKVGPVPNMSGNGTSRISGALSGLASATGLNLQSSPTSQFELYLETIYSWNTAERLSREQDLMLRLYGSEWDRSARVWQERSGPVKVLSNAVRVLFGLPVQKWVPPGPARMQSFLRETVAITRNTKEQLVTVQFSDPDPVFAVEFLKRLNSAIDDGLRERASSHAQAYIKYLIGKLATTNNADHRAALTQVLIEQEQSQMMTSSRLPYAADTYDGPAVSTAPTMPRPMVVLIGATLSGGLLAAFLALFFDPGDFSKAGLRVRSFFDRLRKRDRVEQF